MSAKQIFLTAVERYDPGDWESYLDQTCGGDRQLRARVTELLEAHLRQNPLLDDAVFSVCPSEQLLERPGMMIGPYRLLDEIGEGGFGVIFLCEQIEPIRRRVALKLLKPGLDSRQVVARFEAERQALAMMEHPNIARVLDAGLAPSGRPYFAMELVLGEPITEYCDQQKLSLPRRLELLIDVCRAVQHAHLKGVIHRDLKPSNILVTQIDGEPVVKVIDFGISKATGNQALTDKTLNTGVLGIIGTPAYMSPEQMALGRVDVNIRCDVYSLGVLLYETLTGETPFDSQALQAAGFDEMRRMIRDCEPPRPSARVAGLPPNSLTVAAENRQTDPGKLCSLLQRELDWITMKAIDKDRARRYQSAKEMADDIARYLRDDPVRACPPSSVYQFLKFARRHQVALITTGLVATALVVGSILSLWQAYQANRERQRADQSLKIEKEALARVRISEASLQRQLYASETADAWNALNEFDRERARSLLDRNQPVAGKPDLREFGWKHINSLWNQSPRKFVGHEAGILIASLSPDDRWIASGDRAGNVKVWSLATGLEVASWNYSHKEITTTVFSPDGKILATAGQDATIRLWSTENWEELSCLRGHTRTICAVGWSPDGKQLASAARDESVRIWEVSTGLETRCLDDMEEIARQVLWTPDGKQLVVADGMAVRSWNTQDWQPSVGHRTHTSKIVALAISPQGTLVASSGYDRNILVYDLATNKLLPRVVVGANVWSLTFSRDGRYLLAGMGNSGPMVWRVGLGGTGLTPVRGGLESGNLQAALQFTQDGANLMVATEENKEIHLWKSSSVFGHEYVSFPEDCLDVDVAADLAINLQSDGTIVIRSFSNGSLRAKLVGHKQRVIVAVISKSNKWLASYAEENEVLLWDLQTFTLRHRLTLDDNPKSVQQPLDIQLEFSPDECLIAAAGRLITTDNKNSVRIWNVAEGTLCRDLFFNPTFHARIAFSPNSDRLAVGTEVSSTIFPIIPLGEPIDFVHLDGRIWQIQFTPDGAQLVTASDSQGAIVWEIVSRGKQSHFSKNRTNFNCFSISPDGQTLASVGNDDALRLWHMPSGQELFTLLQHSRQINWVKFASNNKLLIGAQLDANTKQGVFVFNAED